MPLPTASEFWHWCCHEYADPTVADTCLALQQRFGVSINLILLLRWLDSQLWHLEPPELQRLCDAPALDDPELQALRGLRKRLKTRLDANTYRQLQTVELQLERQQQSGLLDTLADFAQQPGHRPHHLAYYLNGLKVPPALWPRGEQGPGGANAL